MRKFLLSSFALLMSVAMMAVGAGDGTNKANAIDFDWTSGNIHEAPGALWYCVDLAPVNAAAEPALVLYLTNLSDEEAAVDVQISLAGTQRTVSYNIAAEGYYRMDLPIAQFREFITVDQVNLALQSNQKIALSAKVYEFPEYVKEAIANSEPIDWNSGVKQDALSTKWYEVDITSLKTEKQHLQVGFINHEASKKALLTATFVLRGENITLPLVVPAGFSTTKVIDYQLLAKLPVNRIHVGVTTDSPIEVVSSTRSAIADDPTPCLNAINAEHGVTYVHEAGDTQWYKISLDLLKSTDAFSSFYLANKGNQRANVTIGMVPDCQYTTGTKITLPIPAGFELGALAPNILGNLIEELTRFESAYNKVDAKDVYLEIKTDQPIHFGLDVTNAATNPCLREDLVTFDWATGAKIEAGKATWFDMELDAVRNLGSHINFTFTNHADSLVWVATVVSVDCPAKVTMPLLVPVPARASVDQLVDYSILDAINIDNIYVGVKADGPVELKATAVNAEVIPSAGCESATVLGSGEYTQNPGTKWYQLPMSLFDEVGAAAKLSFKNLTGSTATLSAGVTVGCEYAIAHRAKVKVPKSIDLSINVPKRILNFARQFVDNDVENFYLQLTTDKAIKFSIDLQAPDVDACRDAVEFDWAAWEKDGLQLEANQDKWYKVNLDYLFNKLENGEDLVVNLVNGSEMDVHVLASVSPTCPALLSVEKTVDIPAESDLYKVFTYEEVMKYVGQYDKYIYDGELEMLLGQLATYKVYNKMVELLERTPFAKFVPFGQVDLLLEAYGDHLTIAGIKDIVNNYEKYLSVAQLKEVLKTQKEYVSLQDAITLIEKYGDYIPYVDAEKILNNYEKYLPAAGGVASILKKCEKYITHENLQKVVDRCKQYLPIEEMKVLINRLKQYLPENNSCYVNIKTTGELIVKPDDPEPPTPEEPCCPEECEDVEVLDWKMVKLSNVELNKLYKLDITGLYSQPTINFFVTNDVHSDTVVIASEIYAHCQDATPVAQHSNKVKTGMSIVKVAHDKFAELVDSAQCCMFVKFTAFDTIPVTPDTPCDGAVYTYNIALCEGQSYLWKVNGKEYSADAQETVVLPDANGCKTTHNLTVTVAAAQTETIKLCASELPYVYEEVNGTTHSLATFGLHKVVLTDGCWMFVDLKDKNCPVPTPECENVVTDTTICAGDVFVWSVNGKEYTETTNVVVPAQTTDGCEFNYVLRLSVINGDAEKYEYAEICEGTSYPWRGLDCTEAKTYTDTEEVKCGTITYYLVLSLKDCSTPDDPCANIPELDWRAGVKLSELQVGWYKMNVAGVHANQESVTANVINDLGCEAIVTLAGYAHCEDEDALYNISATVAVGDTSKVVSYDVFQGVVAPHVEVIYVNIESIVTNCEPIIPGEDCEHATLLDWRNGVRLSQLSAGWYKLYVGDVHANQESVTAKVINDLTCKATVTAYSYAHCESDEALSSDVAKTFKLGESVKTVSYADFSDVVAPHLEYVYVNVISIVEDCEPIIPGDDCEHATLLDWRNGVRLSQLSAGWYKLYVGDVHANQESVTAKVINDLTCKATVTAYSYAHCESDEALSSDVAKTFKLGETVKTVSYADFSDVVAPHLEYVYVNVISIVEDCEPIEPGEDCEHAILLDWSDVKLSQLVEGNWYKLDFSEVHANQLNPTFKATNDLNGDASVSAVAYYHCEDADAMGNATKKLAQGHVGEREVSYKELTDMIGQAEVLYVQVTDITVAGEDCEHAIALDWSDVKLSQLVEGNWYKLDFSEVQANQLNPTFKATNDLNGDASVSAVAYYHCEDTDAMGDATKKLAQGHVGEREVSYKELTDMIGHAEVLYVQVTDITVAGEDCEHAIALDWSDVKLSQLVEGNWYKLDFSEVQANQSSATFKATNDLNGDASVSAVAYYHCEDTDAMGDATKKLAQGHVGEREVSYKELTDMIGQADVLYVQVTDITVAGEDCEHAIALDWSDVKLSQLVEGNWYKLDFSEVQANQSSATFKATNDLNGDASVSAVAYYHCEDTDAMGDATKKLAQGHVGEREVSYKELTDMIGQADVLYVQVTDITVAGEDCEHAIALDWSDVKLSQLVEGNWYKLDFSEVQANQSSATFKATNDLNGDASVSAVAYYHCEDTEAMGNATKKLVQGHVGEREVSYKELTDMIGQADVLYVQVTDITVTIVDPCADIPEIDWTKGIKLSQLQEGAMYKLNVASVHEGKADVMVSVENDLTCKTRVAASAYYDCQDDETFFEGSYAFELGAKEYVVKYDEFQDYVAEYIEYVYVQVDKIECAEKDTVDVAEFVCDGTEYVDALGEKHIISSLLDPALLTWTAETTDTVYNYVITPIVAPAEMTAELLATIPGAMPVLVAGEKVDVTGTVEAIKNYYDAQDTEAVADVETVVWTAGADATLACEAKSHTMLLTVTSGCEFEWTVELTLDVTPVDVVETTETATICEGETYEWDGKQLSETGSYPMEITNAAGCVVEIKTLELTVTPAETVTLAAVEACDSYEWHGVTYTESGEYTYTENCKTEVLPLTIVKSETVTLAAVEACDSYEWHGVTYTESGEYTYTENCKTEVLPLTIVKSETVTLAAVEACDSYEWHGVTYTESGEYTYTENCKTEVLPLTIVKSETVTLAAVEVCDSYEWHGVTYTESGEYTYTENCKTEVLPLTIVKSETITLDPVVACESYEWHGVTYTESGEYTYTDNCMTEVLKLTINTIVTEEITVTECHAYTWRGETYTVSGDYTYEGDCYKEILHLTIEGQIPENNPELAEAEAVAKYGNRLVMLHLNNFVEKYGWTPAAGDVMWYQVNGDVDTSWEVENDTPLGTGYYIDSQEGYTGEVYAVINASTEDKCQNIYRTKIIALVPAGQAPKLMPTIARPSEDLHLMNLNPSNVTEVRVFNTSGELMATYQAEEASEFVFKAATLPGYYMVEVQHNGEQTTLRYIVK